ncbi:putative disease resistance RPP13-like protein 1 [Arachis hypogaea]|uniref:putative disease resistance RPP13-like protein 1 n=1 Tax=Arachis hypogaea TaxID=3818 RepID=UPI0010FC445E|nr:putative disease resistance RPP13-like protein 1 [Arachis hypogaea]
MAAELVGGAFLSSFLNVLFDRMSDPAIVNGIRGKKIDQKLLGRLKTTLRGAEALLNDAERRQIKEGPVKVWLDDLKDALYEADDFLDEITTKASTQKDPGNFLSRFLNMKDREMVACMEEVIGRLESIVNKKRYSWPERDTDGKHVMENSKNVSS